MFYLEQFLARDLEPCLRLRIGPDINDVIELSQASLEARSEDLGKFLKGIPEIEDGASWQNLRAYANWNGTGAKVMVALGDYLKVWKAHPPQSAPELWTRDLALPIILAGTVDRGGFVVETVFGKQRIVDPELRPCDRCKRPMGPWNSSKHDLVAGDPWGGTCIECASGIGPGA
jgi:hypothetical protein